MFSTLTSRSLSIARITSSRAASTLVVSEAADAGALAAVTAAGKIGGDVSMLILGSADEAAKASKIIGVAKVLHGDSPKNLVNEKFADSVKAVVEAGTFTHVISPGSNAGKNVIPRVGAMMNSAPVSDVIEILSEDTFVRPMYAGNALAKVKATDPIKFLTIRVTAFDKAEAEGGSAEVVSADVGACASTAGTFVSEAVAASDRPDLTAAPVVISGGRGMKNGENFGMLETLADKLGGAVGASRAAVDAGYVPNDLQVGQTGKVVAPDLYVAVGISGAIQHLSGMKDSKTIVAINKDKEAPIFAVSDYGLVADLFDAVPDLTSKV